MVPAEYTNLVIEGGGVLGIAYVGAIKALENYGIMSNITNYAGASAGAIIAGALACGADSKYIEDIMSHMNFKKFIDYGSKVRAVYNTLYHNGACPGDYFSGWYEDIILQLTGNGKITLQQVHNKFGGRLVISVVNISKRVVEFWDYKNKPDMPLVVAVRASMSIPGIFMPVEISGDLYIDGGTLCNYPIKAFHLDSANGDIINPRTLGLMLMSAGELNPKYPRIETLLQCTTAIIGCMWSQPQKLHMDQQDWERTIKIPTGDLSSIDFNITKNEAAILIQSGVQAVTDYIEGVKHKWKPQCIKSAHSTEDEIKLVRRGDKVVYNPKRAVTGVSAGVSASYNAEWERFKDEIIQDKAISSRRKNKVKSVVGSSPPISIPEQFHLE